MAEGERDAEAGPVRGDDATARDVDGEEADDEPEGPAFSVDAERRVVTLAGRPVATVAVHPGRVRVEVRALEGSVEVVLRGPFELEGLPAPREPLSPSRPASVAPLLAWVGRSADRVEVTTSRRLTLRLDDGATLVAEAGFGGDGWEVQGAGDLEAVPAFLG